MLATEKVTRKALDADDQKRLVEEALSEVDFSALAGQRQARRRPVVEEIARVYAEALFQVAKEQGKLDAIREQLGQFADARRREPRPAGLLLQPLLLLGREARRDLAARSRGRSPSWSTSSSCSPRSTGCRSSSASATGSTSSGHEENKQLEVTLTSAVELDPEVVERVGAEIERQTDRKIELETEVDEGIIGGLVLRVGNMVLDASLRGRLEKLRKEVAQAAVTRSSMKAA